VIVNLAIEHDDVASAPRYHWLVTGSRWIHDRKSAMHQGRASVCIVAFVIWPPMPKMLLRCCSEAVVTAAKKSGNAAH
jgi:hypothetical protein